MPQKRSRKSASSAAVAEAVPASVLVLVPAPEPELASEPAAELALLPAPELTSALTSEAPPSPAPEPSPAPPQIGRPSDFTEALAEEICERIALGEPVRQICLLAPMPDERTIYRWLLKHDSFREMYTRAKEAQAERLAEEVLEIADDGTNDWIERQNERTGKTTVVHDTEAVQRSKLRVAARQWLMAKYRPRKYGDKVAVEHSGEVKSTVTVLSEERRKQLAEKKRNAVLRRMEGGKANDDWRLGDRSMAQWRQ